MQIMCGIQEISNDVEKRERKKFQILRYTMQCQRLRRLNK